MDKIIIDTTSEYFQSDLAVAIKNTCSDNVIFDLIIELDELVRDLEFTERLRDYFNKIFIEKL